MSFHSETIAESRKKGLLVAIYKPSKKQVKIGESFYLIEEAWITYKTKNRHSKEISPYSKRFQIVVSSNGNEEEKGVKVNDLMYGVEWEDKRVVSYIMKDSIYPVGYYDQGIFIDEEIDYDTIKIEFLDDKKNKTIIDFIKI